MERVMKSSLFDIMFDRTDTDDGAIVYDVVDVCPALSSKESRHIERHYWKFRDTSYEVMFYMTYDTMSLGFGNPPYHKDKLKELADIILEIHFDTDNPIDLSGCELTCGKIK